MKFLFLLFPSLNCGVGCLTLLLVNFPHSGRRFRVVVPIFGSRSGSASLAGVASGCSLVSQRDGRPTGSRRVRLKVPVLSAFWFSFWIHGALEVSL